MKVYVNMFAMNKSVIKFITDFGPLLVFFIIYYKNDNNFHIEDFQGSITHILTGLLKYYVQKK